MPTLFIANKIYLTWSLRPWILIGYYVCPSYEEWLCDPLNLRDTGATILAIIPCRQVPV